MHKPNKEDIKRKVRETYGRVAVTESSGCGCKRNVILGLVVAGLAMPSLALAQDPFSGIYGAVEGGIGIINKDGTVLAGAVDETEKSALIGVVLGMRSSIGRDRNFVIGLEVNGDSYAANSDWRYGISGIAGVKVRDKNLVHLRVGYGEFNSDNLDLNGLVIGGGYERLLGDSTSLRFDYKYLNYGDVNYADDSIDYGGHEITTAFVLRFGAY